MYCLVSISVEVSDSVRGTERSLSWPIFIAFAFFVSKRMWSHPVQTRRGNGPGPRFQVCFPHRLSGVHRWSVHLRWKQSRATWHLDSVGLKINTACTDRNFKYRRSVLCRSEWDTSEGWFGSGSITCFIYRHGGKRVTVSSQSEW